MAEAFRFGIKHAGYAVLAVGIIAAAGFGYLKYRDVNTFTDPAKLERAAALSGKVSAQMRMAEIYNLGIGVPVDKSEAARWYRLAAEQGSTDAQFALAEILMNGDGLTANPAEAYLWYQKAGTKGHITAQFKAADMLETGIGVPADPIAAYVAFKQMAAKGDAVSDLRAISLEAGMNWRDRKAAHQALQAALDTNMATGGTGH